VESISGAKDGGLTLARPAGERNLGDSCPFLSIEGGSRLGQISKTLGCLVLVSLSVTSASAQSAGRPQDGFYSGQSNGQVGGQSNGQVTGRVDGRASKTEGLPPSAGDASISNPPVERRERLPNNAESMDAIVRPGLK
jgi:hypothetical protein